MNLAARRLVSGSEKAAAYAENGTTRTNRIGDQAVYPQVCFINGLTDHPSRCTILLRGKAALVTFRQDIRCADHPDSHYEQVRYLNRE